MEDDNNVEQDLKNLQFLGIRGILQETFKLIHQWRRIFTHITLLFILPLSLLVLANSGISNFFLQKISHDQQILNNTQKSTPEFLKLHDLVSSERIFHALSTLAFFVSSAAFSLLSTSAIVFTVASIYAARAVSFKHVTAAVPKLWRRLLLTFVCVLAGIFAFNFVALSVLFLVPVVAVVIYGPDDRSFSAGIEMILFLFIMFYCTAAWYLMSIWGLSSVVSALELDCCGFKAMAKSKALVEGRMRMVLKLLALLNLPLVVVQFVFYYLVVQSATTGAVGRGILGIVWVLLFLVLYLVKLVAETVLYFVCKSYNHESVDKSALSDHLQGYLMAEYVELKVEDDVQLQKLQVV